MTLMMGAWGTKAQPQAKFGSDTAVHVKYSAEGRPPSKEQHNISHLFDTLRQSTATAGRTGCALLLRHLVTLVEADRDAFHLADPIQKREFLQASLTLLVARRDAGAVSPQLVR